MPSKRRPDRNLDRAAIQLLDRLSRSEGGLRSASRAGMYTRLSMQGLAKSTPCGAREVQARMPRLVMKFGGTSVADIERIRNVARHVKREIDGGREVAVVVSAMAGATDLLAAL